MSLKKKALEKLEGFPAGRRLVHDARYRVVLTAAGSLLVNLLYALYNGVLGIANRSVWFLTMCAYYTILSTLRFSAVLCGRKGSEADTEHTVMTLSGLLLAGLSFVLSGVAYISLSENIATKHGDVVMITIAAYTFFKIAMAVRRAVRQRKDPSSLLAVLRGIGYADVAASVFTLQRSMFASFGELTDAKAHIMNIITGAAVCLFVLLLGVAMTLRGFKRKENSLGKVKIQKGQ
ncbi:MAG: hypothetical protein ACI3VX_03300 [Faecousia sp.]